MNLYTWKFQTDAYTILVDVYARNAEEARDRLYHITTVPDAELPVTESEEPLDEDGYVFARIYLKPATISSLPYDSVEPKSELI